MERTAYTPRSARGGQRAGRTGICLNTDNCQKAKDKEKIVVRTGDFVCPECGNELHEIKEAPKQKNWKLIGGIAAAVVAIIVLIICLFPSGNDAPTQEPQPKTPPKEVPPVAVPKDTLTNQDTTEVETNIETQTEVSTIPEGAIAVEGGYYEGASRNGLPHGSGIITYLKATKIVPSKDYVAQPGETVTGTFRDGKLMTGTWTQKNGNKVRVNR